MENAQVLIVSHPGDTHAAAVLWALGEGQAVWWEATEILGDVLRLSIELNGADDSRVLARGLKSVDLVKPWDVVWLRRPPVAIVRQDLHPADKKIAEREGAMALAGALNLIAPNARWINPIQQRAIANSKPYQLSVAKKVGLEIPKTLISNDPDDIRKFYADCGGDIIFKSFYQAYWSAPVVSYSTYAAKVPASLLNDDIALSAVPGIYQRRIVRRREIRLTMFGRTCIAAELKIPPSYGDEVDWRVTQDRLGAIQFDLEEGTKMKCFDLMQALGIKFACIDLIESENGRMVFLEVNEMGNFLWLEDANPEILLLAPFTDFLRAGCPDDFQWVPRDDDHRTMSTYRATDECQKMHEQDVSIYLNATYKVQFSE